METPMPNTTQITPPTAPQGSGSTSGNDHKTLAIVGYVIPLLFFVPLLSEAKNDPYAKFHANQQLNLLLFWVATNILAFIPIIGWVLMPFAFLFGLVLMILGIMNAANMRNKELPLIGKFSLLK
jgi:uncharacterized membrane protein